jgi:lipoprotein LprG
MRAVETVQLEVEIDGPVGDLSVRRARGVLTREGEASGTFQLEQGGRLYEYAIVIGDRTYHVKGPTGGFQVIPAETAAGLYDPSRFLDPDEGLASMLAQATAARTEAAEPVGGRDAYRVGARVATDLLRGLLPLEEGQNEVQAVLWIGADRLRLLQIQVSVRVAGQATPTMLTLSLTAFDVPADIEPPTP